MHVTPSRSRGLQEGIDSSVQLSNRNRQQLRPATGFVVGPVASTTDRSFIKRGLVDEAKPEEERTRQLLCRVAEGNIPAFWMLWDLHRGHLYQLCLWQMGGVQEDAEDALSRAMLRALEKLPDNACKIGNFKAWLSRLTLNLCVDMHRERRRQVRRLESIESTLPGAGERVPIRVDSPEEGLINREVFAYVCSAVDDLPRRLREPFVLRFFQEMDYREIAERLILSTENVRKRIQLARDILREELSRFLLGSPGLRTGNGHGMVMSSKRAAPLHRSSSGGQPRFLGA
jgi:RNA polymerase sigma-70 factor (ECF subfamily)